MNVIIFTAVDVSAIALMNGSYVLFNKIILDLQS